MAGILAGLDAEVVAIALLFALLVAVLIIRPLLVGVLAQAPVIGDWLASNVDSGLASFEAAIAPAAQGALGVFSDTVNWVQAQGTQLAQTVVGLAQLAYTAAYRITYVILPNASDVLLQQAEGLTQGAEAYALGLTQDALVTAGQEVTQAEAVAVALVGAEHDFAVAAVQTVETDLAAGVALVEADAVALFQTVETDLAAGIATAEGYAASLYAAAVAQIAAAQAVLGTQIGALAAEDERAIQDAIRNLTGDISAAQAAAIAASAIAVSAVAADVRAIENSRCFLQCNVLGALGEGIQAFEVVTVLTAVAVMARDPRGSTRFLTDNLGPAIDDGLNLARSIIQGS